MSTARTATSKASGKSSTARKATAREASSGDALALLSKDHKEVAQRFGDYAKLVKAAADDDQRLEVAQQICAMLTAHATIEEELFYPALREAIEAEDLLDEAEVEHTSIKELVTQIEAMDPTDDLYDAKVTVLGEYVKHHVKEEEDEIFPKARKADLDLAQLGEQLKARKEELLEATESQGM
jgi:hemerythrin superfamily protein